MNILITNKNINMDTAKVYSGTQDEMTEIFYDFNKNVLVCAEHSNYPIWYMSDCGFWRCIDEISIGKMIKDQLILIYDHQSRIPQNKDIVLITKTLTKLKTDKFIKKLSIHLRHYFYNCNFLKQLDSNPDILCFGKDLYDLNTDTWNLTESTDMCSFKCGVDKSNINNNNLELLMKILLSIFTTEERLQYMINTFATYLCGRNRNQKFHIWINMNSGDESFLKTLFLKTFGDYCDVLNSSLLTKINTPLAKSNDELYKVKGIRIGFFNEPDKKVNNGNLKSWIANETVCCRKKNSSPVEFHVNMKFIILCNNKFLLKENSDKSIKMRTDFIDFKTNGKPEYDEFKTDEFVNLIKGTFMQLLIDTYKNLQLNNFQYEIPNDIIGDGNYFVN